MFDQYGHYKALWSVVTKKQEFIIHSYELMRVLEPGSLIPWPTQCKNAFIWIKYYSCRLRASANWSWAWHWFWDINICATSLPMDKRSSLLSSEQPHPTYHPTVLVQDQCRFMWVITTARGACHERGLDMQFLATQIHNGWADCIHIRCVVMHLSGDTFLNVKEIVVSERMHARNSAGTLSPLPIYVRVGNNIWIHDSSNYYINKTDWAHIIYCCRSVCGGTCWSILNHFVHTCTVSYTTFYRYT